MKSLKCLACMLALAFLLTALSACGRGNAAPSSVHEALSIVSLFPNMDGFIEKVHEKYPEISFEIIPYDGYNTTAYLGAQLRSGDIPDIYLTTVYTPGRHSLSDRLIDLSGYSFTNNYTAASLHEVSDNGAIYLLPTYFSCIGITYNKTLLDAHGWKLPSTFAELRALAPKVKEAGCRLALNQIAFPGYGFQYLCNIMDTGFFNTIEGRKWQNDFLDGKATVAGSEGMLEAFSILEQWKELGMLSGEGSWNNDAATRDMMAEGNTLFMLGSTNSISSEASSDEFRLMPYLSEDGTKNSLITQVSRYIGLNKNLEKDPQKLADALHVLEVLSTVEGMSALNCGCSNSQMLPLKDYVIPETSYYQPVADALYNGQTAPFIFSGWEDIIVAVGNAGIDYICGSATLEDLIAAFDDNQVLICNNTDESYTTVTQKLTNDDCVRLIGECFGRAAGAELALISRNEYHSTGGCVRMNPEGVSGELYALPVTDQEITSILPTGWRGNIQIVTLTGARIRKLVDAGYERSGTIFPYALVKPDSLTIDDEETYTVVITGVNDQIAAEGKLTDTGILGLTAAQAYFSQFETFSKEDILWE